jgi:DNA-directed RNA polymerase specialized sigma subunit
MVSESVPYLAKLKPLITAKLAVWGLMTGETDIPGHARLNPNHVSDADAVERIVNRLSPEQRMLLALRYKEGLSWDKIAMELDVGRRIVYEMHSAILTVLAYEFGLL